MYQNYIIQCFLDNSISYYEFILLRLYKQYFNFNHNMTNVHVKVVGIAIEFAQKTFFLNKGRLLVNKHQQCYVVLID